MCDPGPSTARQMEIAAVTSVSSSPAISTTRDFTAACGRIVAFRPPAPIRARAARTALPEDVFVAGLEAVIARDFFPDLAKLRAQRSYLDALATGDEDQLRHLRQRYTPCSRDSILITPRVRERGAEGEEGEDRESSHPSSLAFTPVGRTAFDTPPQRKIVDIFDRGGGGGGGGGEVAASSPTTTTITSSTKWRMDTEETETADNGTAVAVAASTSSSSGSKNGAGEKVENESSIRHRVKREPATGGSDYASSGSRSSFIAADAASSSSDIETLPDTTLTLSAYLNKYTSEDNDSFNGLLDTARARLHAENERLYNNSHAGKIQRRREQQAAALRAKEEGNFYQLDTWHYESRNALMYGPEGLETSSGSGGGSGSGRRRSGVASGDTSQPTTVNTAATRFACAPFPRPGAPMTALSGTSSTSSTPRSTVSSYSNSSSNSVIDAAAATRHLPLASRMALGNLAATISAADDTLSSPRVNGYGFVTTPDSEMVARNVTTAAVAVAGAGAEGNDGAVVGEINGQQFHLDAADMVGVRRRNGGGFAIPDESSRETTARRLASHAGEGVRKRKRLHNQQQEQQQQHTPRGEGGYSDQQKTPLVAPRIPAQHLYNLSPAAQRLAKHVGQRRHIGGRGAHSSDGTSGSGSSSSRRRGKQSSGVESFGSSLRASYSPSPRAHYRR